ncbi:hypothetical protein HaLaN_07222, partial [Haematococcus lacustris]
MWLIEALLATVDVCCVKHGMLSTAGLGTTSFSLCALVLQQQCCVHMPQSLAETNREDSEDWESAPGLWAWDRRSVRLGGGDVCCSARCKVQHVCCYAGCAQDS